MIPGSPSKSAVFNVMTWATPWLGITAASIMRALATDLRPSYQGEPVLERDRPFVEQPELTAQTGDHGHRLGWRPAEAVDLGGSCRHNPEFHQHLGRQHKRVAGRKQAAYRLFHRPCSGAAGSISRTTTFVSSRYVLTDTARLDPVPRAG